MEKRAMTIGSILEHIFSCPHRRLTRPITPVSKPGEPAGETYVVCLDCGRQFAYDWDQMRVGKPIARSAKAGVLPPDMPAKTDTRIKWALLGSALPLGVLLGNALRSGKRTKPPVPGKK
jgi:hypothetical protein